MGRELKRKEAKRSGKNVREVQKLDKEKVMTVKSLIVIMIVVLSLFGITYLSVAIFGTKDIKLFNNNNKGDEEEVSSVRNKILASESLKQSENDYFVYFYDDSNENLEISDVVNGLSNIVYRVDLGDDFNSNYVGEASGIVSDINDLKVSDPTVIRVSSGVITGFYTGEEIKTLK